MSISVTCEHLIKRYGSNTIIPDLSLKVKEGEFFTLLGPSGCGKTTLLRMMIGFNSIEGGTIAFGERVINDVPANKRNVGMVFQNYAIFPHMTTFENVAFGLKNRKVPKDEIKQRVDEILRIVHIEDLRDRLPDKMSGGQQQRIALARAIVINPDLLLMDEPLSNLDAKLRVEMRNAIKDIQKKLGITTVYVTHDQEEALAVSDRIAVMKSGVVQHVGTPQNIYNHPNNLFVATFIGRSNIIPASVYRDGQDAGLLFDGGYRVPVKEWTTAPGEGARVKVSVRPEDLLIQTDGNGIQAVIVDSVFLGLNTHYFLETKQGLHLEAIRISEREKIPNGAAVCLQINCEKLNVFDEVGDRNLLQGVQNDLEEAQT